MQAMEIMGSVGELSSGYKLVPWSNWDQWTFVKESLFSSSPDSVSKALQKISAWRSRACLPVPIDVTSAIVEIQQKDPYFRAESTSDVLNSEELLSMLYCMAIMRLVNCFVEPGHKKTGSSISQLAESLGIPRMLVDIRHESSHRDLPSLRLVRVAGIKALDWLKSNYWEPQQSAIPDVRKEVRLRLHEMSIYLKRLSSSQGKEKRGLKQSGQLIRCTKLSSQLAGKLHVSKLDVYKKRISKITKIIARLYSSYPSEVVAVLLEFFHLQAPTFSNENKIECSEDSTLDDMGPHVNEFCDLKIIITKLSGKKPGLILGIVKTVLEIIEEKERSQSKKGEHHFLASKYQSEKADINHLCSLALWLLEKLKAMKDSNRIGILSESQILPSTDVNASPNVSLTKLLRKILSLSVIGNTNLSTSVSLLATMIDNAMLARKIMKIPLPMTQHQDFMDESSTFKSTESMLIKEEASIKKEKEKLELLKLNLKKRKCSSSASSDNKRWNLAKSWVPCAIGMLPCSFSSTAIVPILDKVEGAIEEKNVEIINNEIEINTIIIEENESVSKKLRMTKEQDLNTVEKPISMKGRLLIGGIWKIVSEDELCDIEANIKIFGKLL